jgi:hypothetical protein
MLVIAHTVERIERIYIEISIEKYISRVIAVEQGNTIIIFLLTL